MHGEPPVGQEPTSTQKHLQNIRVTCGGVLVWSETAPPSPAARLIGSPALRSSLFLLSSPDCCRASVVTLGSLYICFFCDETFANLPSEGLFLLVSPLSCFFLFLQVPCCPDQPQPTFLTFLRIKPPYNQVCRFWVLFLASLDVTQAPCKNSNTHVNQPLGSIVSCVVVRKNRKLFFMSFEATAG